MSNPALCGSAIGAGSRPCRPRRPRAALSTAASAEASRAGSPASDAALAARTPGAELRGGSASRIGPDSLAVRLDCPTPFPLALDGLIRSRALVLDEIARPAERGTHAANEGADPRAGRARSAQQRLANLHGARAGPVVARLNTPRVIEAARRDSEAAEQALAERSAEFRAERGRAQIGLDEVTAALPADSALVSFVRYDRTRFRSADRSPSEQSARRRVAQCPSYLAFVLRRASRRPLCRWARRGPSIRSCRSGGPTSPPKRRRRRTATRRRRCAHLAYRAWPCDSGSGIGWRSSGRCEAGLHRAGRRAEPGAVRGAACRATVLSARAGPVIHYLSAERDLGASRRLRHRRARSSRRGRTLVRRPEPLPRRDAKPADSDR